LRPSSMRMLAASVKGVSQLRVVVASILINLHQIKGTDLETIERVYLFGTEMRNVLERSVYRPLDLQTEVLDELETAGSSNDGWQVVQPAIRAAFLGGFTKRRFKEVLNDVTRSAEVAEVSVRSELQERGGQTANDPIRLDAALAALAGSVSGRR
jgi:hypothetical protein